MTLRDHVALTDITYLLDLLAVRDEEYQAERRRLVVDERSADWLLGHSLEMLDELLAFLRYVDDRPVPWPLRAMRAAIQDKLSQGNSKLFNRRIGTRSDRFYDAQTREKIQALAAATLSFMKEHNDQAKKDSELARSVAKALRKGGYQVGPEAVESWFYRWTDPERFWEGKRDEPLCYDHFDRALNDMNERLTPRKVPWEIFERLKADPNLKITYGRHQTHAELLNETLKGQLDYLEFLCSSERLCG